MIIKRQPLKVFTLFFILFTAMSCTKKTNNDEMQMLAAHIDASLDLRVKDANANDLLEKDVKGAYHYSDIDVIYYENNKPMAYNNPLSSSPKNFYIYNFGGENILRLFLTVPKKNQTESITYLRFGGKHIYTIKSEFEKIGLDYIGVKDIWVDDVHFWSKEDSQKGFPLPIIITTPKE